MKKLLILLVAFVALAGCTEDDKMDRIIKDFVVEGGDWRQAPETGYPDAYYYTFRFPELDSHIYDNGTIVAYYEYQNGGNKYQKVLPTVTPLWNIDPPHETWTTVVDYEYTRGYITFKVTNDDFYYGEPPFDPGTMRFRVVILW